MNSELPPSTDQVLILSPQNKAAHQPLGFKAKWSRRLAVISVLLWGLPCVIGLGPSALSLVTGEHFHPWTKWFQLVLYTAMFGSVGLQAAAIVLGLLAIREIDGAAGRIGGRPIAKSGITIAGVSFLVFAAICKPSGEAQEAAYRTQCKCYLKQIGLAMHNYHDACGCYPPAAICDAQGQPLLSWRVVILPFIEEYSLYKEFHLDEPWDSPHNLPLVQRRPAQFHCLSDKTLIDTASSYVIVIGKETYFPPQGQVRVQDVKDGTSLTVMVGEKLNNKEPWTKPDELFFDDTFNGPSHFSSAHDKGWQVLMGDGTARFLSNNTRPEIARSIMTIAGGEMVDEDDF